MNEDLGSQQKAMIQAWCSIQLGWWLKLGIDREAALLEYSSYNNSRAEFFLFCVKNQQIHLIPKPEYFNVDTWLKVRVDFYKTLLDSVLQMAPLPEGLHIPIVLGDIPFSSERVPIFCFQKTNGEVCPLINDIDFMHLDFYQDSQFADPLAYLQKRDAAVFVGSTTGSTHTVESIRDLQNQRISAAVAFKDEACVDFRLPVVVQCNDVNADRLLREMGFGDGKYASWQEQFTSKFIISMDGNGATCSRVAIALKSNSVLLKYDSPSILYYFPTLLPWVHYIPVKTHSDVIRAIDRETASPGIFQHIAENGRKFYEDHLDKKNNLAYTRTLLSVFAECFL